MEEDFTFHEHSLYYQIVGCINRCNQTCRPDVSFAAFALSRFNFCPQKRHFKYAMHCIRYLAAHAKRGITYRRCTSLPALMSFADSSYNVFATDSKSVTGFLILCFTGLILWKSEKQSIIAFSPNEAEYIALCAAAKGAFFVRQFLLELKVGIPEKVITFLFGDNKGANQLANYPITTARNRHIRLQYHTIREYVERKELTVLKIATAKNPADALTKSLDGEKHLPLTRFVMEDTPEVEMKGVTPSRF